MYAHREGPTGMTWALFSKQLQCVYQWRMQNFSSERGFPVASRILLPPDAAAKRPRQGGLGACPQNNFDILDALRWILGDFHLGRAGQKCYHPTRKISSIK